MNENLESIRQEHESFLAELEGLAVKAIANNDWNDFYQHLIEFQTEHDLHGVSGIVIGEDDWNPDQAGQEMSELFRKADQIFEQASTADMDSPGAGFLLKQSND